MHNNIKFCHSSNSLEKYRTGWNYHFKSICKTNSECNFHGRRRHHCVAWQNPWNPHMRIGWLVNEDNFVTTSTFASPMLKFYMVHVAWEYQNLCWYHTTHKFIPAEFVVIIPVFTNQQFVSRYMLLLVLIRHLLKSMFRLSSANCCMKQPPH
jgi:hypothetical protein